MIAGGGGMNGQTGCRDRFEVKNIFVLSAGLRLVER
jgi:hypothetical protein